MKSVVGILGILVLLGFISGKEVTTLKIDESYNRQTVTVLKGQQIELTLKSNPTTGFTWQYGQQFDQKVIKEVSHRYLSENEDRTGAGGKDIWVYKTVNPGETKIYLEQKREWEKKEPIQTFEVTVIVKK